VYRDIDISGIDNHFSNLHEQADVIRQYTDLNKETHLNLLPSDMNSITKMKICHPMEMKPLIVIGKLAI